METHEVKVTKKHKKLIKINLKVLTVVYIWVNNYSYFLYSVRTNCIKKNIWHTW